MVTLARRTAFRNKENHDVVRSCNRCVPGHRPCHRDRAAGHHVIATARRPEALADLPVDQRLRLDVTDQDSVDAAIRDAGEVDVLVSNAGETVRVPLESASLDEVERLFRLDTLGSLRVTQGLLPAMRARGAGRLVFVASIQGRMVLPLIGPYGATKWALEALAKILAIETGHFGIKVSLVQPGAVSSGGEPAKVSLPAKHVLEARKSAGGQALPDARDRLVTVRLSGAGRAGKSSPQSMGEPTMGQRAIPRPASAHRVSTSRPRSRFSALLKVFTCPTTGCSW
ncbi:SDR family NAD(P)-dependent oxidoreductase [Amycolatopsis sp. NPDC051372]|uniref:SDR family NAD(P)-dependent oxidoreductase n=1 Tax=Amycolatopsis sp. NPDC051372 TaxID=3155669 RepID=UPI0034149C28